MIGRTAVWAGVFLAACGGNSQPPEASPSAQGRAATARPEAAPAAVDACRLLTKVEVEAVLGTAVKEPVKDPSPPPFFGCRWEAPEPGSPQVGVLVVVHDSSATAAGSLGMALELNKYPEVPGVGDRAYASPIFDITAIKGRFEVSVDVPSGDRQKALGTAKELAIKVIERLP